MGELVVAAPERSSDRPEPQPAAYPGAADRASVPAPRSGHDFATIPVHASGDSRHERQAHAIAGRLVASRGPAADGDRTASHVAVHATRAAVHVAPRVAPRPDSRLGPGRVLSISERARYEPALGMDLGAVRVHDGLTAKLVANERRAHAFTYGNHVVLGPGAEPGGTPGRERALAHELAHVRQQARGPPETRGPPVHPAPLAVQCWEFPDLGVTEFVSDAASTAADVGGAALDTAVEFGGAAAEVALDAASVVVERLAPGLLDFLRGGALSRLTDLLCDGVNALLTSLFSSLADFYPMSAIESTFTDLAQGVRDIQSTIGGAASSVVGTLLRPLVEALGEWGNPIVETLQSAADSVNEFFGGLWDNFAVPALNLLEEAGGAAWSAFTGLVDWLWDLTAPIRAGAQYAWDWLTDTFDLAWDSISGVRQWLGGVASSAWESLLTTIEPIRGPLTTAAGVLLLLSPLGPVIVLTQVVPPLWEAITWLWENWNTEDILVAAQDVLREDILPTVIDTVSGVAIAAAAAASWLATIVGEVGAAMSSVLTAFGGSSCLTAATTFLNGIADQFTRLAAWADGGFSGLNEAMSALFDALVALFQPILDFLVRLVIVAANPFMLPVALAAAIWLLCPDDLKPPVIMFVLALLIAALTAFPAFLTGLGPLAALMKQGVLGFLEHLRSGEGVDDQLRVDASNKIANLAAGGGAAFIGGYALGLLHGVIDGVIDPFRLIFLLAQLFVAAMQAIAQVIGPYLSGVVPGMQTTPTAEPAAVGAAAAEAVVSVPVAAEPVAVGSNAVEPAPAAAVPGVPAAGAGPSAEEMVELAPEPGDLTDAEIITALPPATLADATAGATEEAVDPTAIEAEMRSETESEGQTIAGLARLLGDAWAAAVAGARSLGASAASALLEFIMLPDFELGRKIGFVAGFLLLQALLIYFSGGGYAALNAIKGPLRAVLVYLLRFLDLGGELFAVLGRALRPLRGPLLSGLGAARGFLSRFRFAAGLLDRIDGLVARVFGLTDEAAAAAATRSSAAVGEAATGRAAREAVEARATREMGQAGTARTTREAGEQATAREADELGEGAIRAADEPGVPTVRDDALKAAQFPAAMAEARAIEAAHDAADSPIPLLLGSLMVLKRQFRWIDTFTARLIGPGVFRIELVASPGTEVGRYTIAPGGPHAGEIDSLMADANARGMPLDREALERLAAEDPAGFRALAAQLREPSGPSFADVSDELGLDAPGTTPLDTTADAVRAAEEAGMLRGGQAGTVDLAVQPHGSASEVRGALGVSGSTHQSAHLGPSSALRGVAGPSRGQAATVILPRQVHTAMDAAWKSAFRQMRRTGRTTLTAGEAFDAVAAAIRQAPGIPSRTKSAMEWRLFHEFFVERGLTRSSPVTLPYPNIRPVP